MGFAGLITGKRFLFYEKRTEQSGKQMLHQASTFSLGLQIDPDNADEQSRLTPEVILAFGVRKPEMVLRGRLELKVECSIENRGRHKNKCLMAPHFLSCPV